MVNESDRRPLASRNTGWANWLSRILADAGVTPNQISIASMGAALLAAALFYMAGHITGGLRIAGLLGGALFCQLRLLCNLLDGMVAVEAGKGSSDGAFWNEMPDRVSDILILAGVGYMVGQPVLGWSVAAFAVLTAYVRELGHALRLAPDFSGPMAKPHRMAAVTIATVIATLAILSGFDGIAVMKYALWIILVGTVLTVARRSWHLVAALKSGKQT